MSEKKFSVVFRGDIVAGAHLNDVKAKLKAIFKVDNARINALFSGKPVSLKTNLSETEAKKYQSVLKQAGIVVSIQASQASQSSSSQSANKNNTSSDAQLDEQQSATSSLNTASKEPESQWSLAPAGSLLQDKNMQSQTDKVDIKIDHLDVLPQEGNLIKDDERKVPVTANVKVDELEWELTPYGEALLSASERVQVEAVDVDTSSLTIAENEGDLVKESERKQIKELNVDTSHLTLL